jgi:hypothetical protein
MAEKIGPYVYMANGYRVEKRIGLGKTNPKHLPRSPFAYNVWAVVAEPERYYPGRIAAFRYAESLPPAGPVELKAGPGRCEEASLLSRERYIPCNAPAMRMVKLRKEGPYRMCAACADHNVRNRGGQDVGPYFTKGD